MFKFIKNFFGRKKPENTSEIEAAINRAKLNGYSYREIHKAPIVEKPKLMVVEKEDSFVEDVVTGIVVNEVVSSLFSGDSSSSDFGSSNDSDTSDWSGGGGEFSGGGASDDW